MNQISQIAPASLPPPSSDPLPFSVHRPSSPITRTRTMAPWHLWGERWQPRGPSFSMAPYCNVRPAQNSLAPPHTYSHNSRQDRYVDLPGKSQVVRKNWDRINMSIWGLTLLIECAQEGACAARDFTHPAHTWVGRVQCGLRFSRHWGRLLELQRLWRMRKGLEDYIFFLPGQSFLCIHNLWW